MMYHKCRMEERHRQKHTHQKNMHRTSKLTISLHDTHKRENKQLLLTEKRMFFLSWLTALESGIGSVCFITLTLSPAKTATNVKPTTKMNCKTANFNQNAPDHQKANCSLPFSPMKTLKTNIWFIVPCLTPNIWNLMSLCLCSKPAEPNPHFKRTRKIHAKLFQTCQPLS